jgi:uncharacterized protein YjbI with pentapeptide repeats
MDDRLRNRARSRRGLLILGVTCVAFLVVWKVPEWPVLAWKAFLTPKDLIELENQTRQTLIQIIAGSAIIAGLYLVWRRMVGTEQLAARALETVREGQLTERYTRAVSQFGSDKLEIRLGGIFALERIARESERDYWPVMEVLCAYVRDAAAWRDLQPPARLATDVQAILTVLGRRSVQFERDESRLNLSHTDLRGANLHKAQLSGAALVGAHLEGADLGSAKLEKADLRGAHLSQADLVQANLNGADLREAHLEGAYVVEAQLEKADLGAARLDGAYLGGANLQHADLSGAHLEGAYLYKAKLDGACLHGARMLAAVGLNREQRALANQGETEDDDAPGPAILARLRFEEEQPDAAERVTPLRARA